MAGICWPPSEERPGGALVTLTQPANADCAPDHERMPVILKPELADAYLHDVDRAGVLLDTYQRSSIKVQPVSGPAF
ncbi:SOS response-associated peptidase family protein [Gallaecimonas xiamenensis]|uniref:Uncharacterized protein n=1 Tax=Gallaecimonas xiamenensis 3-C-1 TaxID=745411 RepID=K2J5U1_9GAMM|nr:SOS response-associated peptidase family protein [Gallaecimonas xiamenensis]EKE70227.1 hypothetical protein B3C1_14033 [Gallaecimonas xiamenensis 3-C-1]